MENGVYDSSSVSAQQNQLQGVAYEGVAGRVRSGDLYFPCCIRTSEWAPGNDEPGRRRFRKLEQAWLDAASVPDLPALRKMFSDDFMGTSFGGGVLSKNDVVPAEGVSANHFPKCDEKFTKRKTHK